MTARGAALALPAVLTALPALTAVTALTLACVSPAPEPVTRPSAPPPAASELDARALLLLMADRRQYDSLSVEALRSGRRELWGELALALGRIGDPRGRQVLESMLLDERDGVRRRAVFSLGRLGDPEATRALRIAVADRDRGTGRRAVEALARLETPLVEVVEAALPLEPAERWERLAPELFRFAPEEIVVLAEEALATAEPAARRSAILALARRPLPAGRPLLRLGLLERDPATRAWAARGLGAVGDGSDLARLRTLLDEPETGPVVQALRASARLIGDGRGAAPADWIEPLALLLEDPRVGVRLTAIEAAGEWLLEPRLGAALARIAAEGPGRERELALLALAAGGDPRALERISRAAVSPDPALRSAAATAAGRLGAGELLTRLESDREAAVRAAVLSARLESGAEDAGNHARRGLIDGAAVVRSTALGWLAQHPVAPLEELALALYGDGARRPHELALDAIAALAARAAAEPLERGAIIATLERMASDEEYLVRRGAADALDELGRPRPVPEPVVTGRTLDHYRQIARRLAGPRRVDLETSRGRIGLELDCAAAPLTCHGFLQLVGQGFYDGLLFHRVVPDFVVQTGDPLGHGGGGPGFTLRDEPNLIRYERGVIGMARSAPDTAGSQFFLTLSRQPHLDGDYTAFGRVVEGDEVLDQLVQGDVIKRMIERSGSGAAG